MKKPDQKWVSVTEVDVGTELGHPSYIEWADERIRSLEKAIDLFFERFHAHDDPDDEFADFEGYIEKHMDHLKDVRDDLR